MQPEQHEPPVAHVRDSATVIVWRAPVRLFHWSLVAAFAVAWFSHEGAGLTHEVAGYAALALVGARLVLGFFSRSNYEKFSSFVRSPQATLAYARDVLARREERSLGHNPLGGWMIVALLLTIIIISTSGWLYTTDAFWGVAWVGDLHAITADLLLWLIALHLAGVAFTSWRHRENLATAMIIGRKRAN